MTDETRSPLGELLRTHRQHLGLSQAELAARTDAIARATGHIDSVSARTVAALEKPLRAGRKRRAPHRSTALALAVALGLEPGSPDHDAFMAAARRPRKAARPAPEPPGSAAPSFLEAGRVPQLQRLSQAIDDAVAGSAGAVLVRGEHGSGKTAIINHACERAVDRHPDAVVLWATCPEISGETGDIERHGPFKLLIRRMIGATSGDAVFTSRINHRRIAERATAGAAALVAEGPLLASISLSGDISWPHLATKIQDPAIIQQLQSLASTQPTDTMRVVPGCDQFLRVLRSYAQMGPVIVVLENLQWIDSGSAASLGHLLNQLQRQRLPVALIGSCRLSAGVGASDTRDGLAHVLEDWQRRYRHPIIDLAETVTDQSARSFVEAMIERSGLEDDHRIVDVVLARTDGNPLYVRELLHHVERLGVSGSADDTAAIIEHALPIELEPVFTNRIDRLPEELQNLLITASVLGSEFDAEALMELLDLPADRFIELVDRQLTHTWRLTRPAGTRIIGGQTMHCYRFHPPMLRDYLSRRLSELEGAHLHGRAARSLIALHGSDGHDALAEIASHFEQAAERVDAARYHLRAGEHARAARDFDLATHHLTRVGQLHVRRDDPTTWIMSLIGLGLCEHSRNRSDTARRHLNHALDLATSHELPIPRGKALEALGMLDFHEGAMRPGIARMREAIDIWQEHDYPGASRAMANLSYLLYGLGSYDAAIDVAQRGRTLATRIGDDRAWVDTTIALANCRVDLGYYRDAMELYERCLTVCDDLSDHHRANLCQVNLALIAVEEADWTAARAHLRQIVATTGTLSEKMRGVVAFHEALIEEGLGNARAAHDHFDHSLAIRDRVGQSALAIDAVAGILRATVDQGDRDAADTHLRDLRRRIEEHGLDGVEHVARVHVAIARAEERIGRDNEARRALVDGVLFLRERAQNIVDSATRASFLGTPPANCWIMEAAARHSVVVGQDDPAGVRAESRTTATD